VFDPNKNGVAQAFQPANLEKAFDPTKNGVANALDPAKNGVNEMAAKLAHEIINPDSELRNNIAPSLLGPLSGVALQGINSLQRAATNGTFTSGPDVFFKRLEKEFTDPKSDLVTKLLPATTRAVTGINPNTITKGLSTLHTLMQPPPVIGVDEEAQKAAEAAAEEAKTRAATAAYAADQARQATESAKWRSGEAEREATRVRMEKEWADGEASRAAEQPENQDWTSGFQPRYSQAELDEAARQAAQDASDSTVSGGGYSQRIPTFQPRAQPPRSELQTASMAVGAGAVVGDQLIQQLTRDRQEYNRRLARSRPHLTASTAVGAGAAVGDQPTRQLGIKKLARPMW
jgi:hypothetical protein